MDQTLKIEIVEISNRLETEKSLILIDTGF
jgi:hypothetical protein